MQESSIIIGLAFLEGLALIISPCILPILPIILSGSLTGSKARPLGIILGFIVAFAIFTLFSKTLIESAHLSPDIIRDLSYLLLIFLGMIMISTFLTEKFNLLTRNLTSVGKSLSTANNSQSGFIGGLVFGALIGIIWTPCAGPILATVIVQVVIQQTSISSILTVIAFAMGAGFPMLLIAFLGRSVLDSFYFVNEKNLFFRKILGWIIIVSVLFFMFGYHYIPTLKRNNFQALSGTSLVNPVATAYQAPRIEKIETWINSPPLTLDELKGKVVLIDFWTYSCINCLRTLPYLKEWYEKYHDNGFVIIGVHSPEFFFERDFNNVKNAVEKLGILYPIALDNQFVTWRNYNNHYWPAHYLINKEGQVVYTHFGEGDYDVTENNIQFLLGINRPINKEKQAFIFSNYETPETYLGYRRAEYFSSPEKVNQNHTMVYHYPMILSRNDWALSGNWIIYSDKIVASSAGAAIKLHFYAKHIYAVMGVSHEAMTVNIRLNNKPIVIEKGNDVMNSQILVDQHRLYSLADFNETNEGIFELIAVQPGLEIYTFTFGN